MLQLPVTVPAAQTPQPNTSSTPIPIDPSQLRYVSGGDGAPHIAERL